MQSVAKRDIEVVVTKKEKQGKRLYSRDPQNSQNPGDPWWEIIQLILILFISITLSTFFTANLATAHVHNKISETSAITLHNSTHVHNSTTLHNSTSPKAHVHNTTTTHAHNSTSPTVRVNNSIVILKADFHKAELSQNYVIRWDQLSNTDSSCKNATTWMEPLLTVGVTSWWFSWGTMAIILRKITQGKKRKELKCWFVLLQFMVVVGVCFIFPPILEWNDSCLQEWYDLLKKNYSGIVVVKELGYTFSLYIAYASLAIVLIVLGTLVLIISNG